MKELQNLSPIRTKGLTNPYLPGPFHGIEPGLSYWRTALGYEVDAILGDARVAIEIKSSQEVHSHHLKGLKAFSEEHIGSRTIVVSSERNKRIMGKIEVFPVQEFLQELWKGSIIH